MVTEMLYFLCFHRVTFFLLTYKVPTSVPCEFTIHATSGKLQKPPIQRARKRCTRDSTSFTSATTLTLHLQTGSVVTHPSMYK
jgi:hypothetical protein